MYPVWLLFFHATIIHHLSLPFHLFIHYTTLIHPKKTTTNCPKISPTTLKKPPLSANKNPNPLWYNKTMNEKESKISKENRIIRKANCELDKENKELKARVEELEEENKRLDESVRALKDELFKLMVENGELKRRN